MADLVVEVICRLGIYDRTESVLTARSRGEYGVDETRATVEVREKRQRISARVIYHKDEAWFRRIPGLKPVDKL